VKTVFLKAMRWLAVAAAFAAAAGCTTTGSSTRVGGDSRGSVTMFGEIDAGVARVR